MPYQKTESLPKSVKDNVPKAAQKIFMEAYNNASKQYKSPQKRRGNASQEETAAKVAWSAVKKKFVKDSKTGKWKKKEESNKK